VVRGTGDMRVPSVTLIATAIVQVAVGGGFGLGLFGLPKLGMAGVATGQLTAFTLGAIFLAWYLASGRSRLKLNFAAFTFQRDMFFDILKVGAVSCLSPLQTVLTILIFTKILASFGTETLAGYGMGSRLEFLLTPIAFAFGVASVPMVGMAMGAGLVARARQVAWTAGAASSLIVGLIGVVVAIWPALWVSLPIPISRWQDRHLPSSEWAPAFTSHRRAPPRSAVRCWPARPDCCWSASAAGGWRRRAHRHGPCSCWWARRWSSTASAPRSRFA
jgi:Na+-driven multidrug efflux pump